MGTKKNDYLNHDKRLRMQYSIEEVIGVLKKKFHAIEHINLSEKEIDSDVYALREYPDRMKWIFIINDPNILDCFVSDTEKRKNEEFNKDVEEAGIPYHERSICPESSQGRRIDIVLESIDGIYFTSFRVLGRCLYMNEELSLLMGVKNLDPKYIPEYLKLYEQHIEKTED